MTEKRNFVPTSWSLTIDLSPRRLLCVLVAVCICGMLAFAQHVRNQGQASQDFEETKHAFVVLASGKVAGKIDVAVVDLFGNPVVDAEVSVATNARSEKIRTDSSGHGISSVSQHAVTQLKVNDVLVLDRPSAGLGRPSFESGIFVMIILKDQPKRDGK